MPKFVVIDSVPKTYWAETATPTHTRGTLFDYLVSGLIRGGRDLPEGDDARSVPSYNVCGSDKDFAGDTRAR